ncbi:MAG TPA: hypothetical protein VFH51_15490 [Myxococcota bacterium]|nr:hypothetical protein [Myxococcota bacterium]
MGNLKDIIGDAGRRAQVVQDCANLVDTEVSNKGGISGLAVKGAYAIVKKVKPGIVPELVDKLLEEFVAQLDPFCEAFKAQGQGSLEGYLSGRATEVASALLKTTDARAAKADNRTLKGAYEKLRPTGVKHVEAAIPGIGRVLSKYV